MLITAIKQTSPGRLTVTLEDEREIKTTLGVVTDLRLFPGRELDEGGLQEFERESRRALTREKALEYLSRRAMSRKELEKKLTDKGYDEEDAAHCAAWLSERGLIDDASYAAAVARHCSAKGYGPGRIRSELSRRGIDRDMWDEVLGAAPRDDSKIDKFISSRLTDPEDRDQVRKVSAALFRRGYSWEDIREALNRFSADITED